MTKNIQRAVKIKNKVGGDKLSTHTLKLQSSEQW